MAAYTTVSSKNRGLVGFAPFDMASPGVLPVTIQSLSRWLRQATNPEAQRLLLHAKCARSRPLGAFCLHRPFTVAALYVIAPRLTHPRISPT
jgi:hypothetical protein